MQALSESKLAPNDLASKIHELQDQWKRTSRGGQQNDESLEQFQVAHSGLHPLQRIFRSGRPKSAKVLPNAIV